MSYRGSECHEHAPVWLSIFTHGLGRNVGRSTTCHAESPSITCTLVTGQSRAAASRRAIASASALLILGDGRTSSVRRTLIASPMGARLSGCKATGRDAGRAPRPDVELSMSSAPRFPSDLGYAGLRMTAREFLAIGEARERLELIDGVVFMSPSASVPHQRLVREILFQLEAYRRTNPTTEVLADVDLVLTSGTVYRPDIIAYADARLMRGTERAEGVPSLVVEVLSPATRAFDLTTKKDDYEKLGVLEYLVVEPKGARVRAFRRNAGRLVELPVDGDSWALTAIPGLVLDLRPVRALGT